MQSRRAGFFMVCVVCGVMLGWSAWTAAWAVDDPPRPWWTAHALAAPRVTVAPYPRSGFERWRRLQPYSIYRDPITACLLQDD